VSTDEDTAVDSINRSVSAFDRSHDSACISAPRPTRGGGKSKPQRASFVVDPATQDKSDRRHRDQRAEGRSSQQWKYCCGGFADGGRRGSASRPGDA
jgi:hypothetical protein